MNGVKCPAPCARRAGAGFTLLEMLLALALLALLMLGIWGALATARRLGQGARQQMERSGRVRTVQHFLREHLADARKWPFVVAGRRQALLFDGGPRQLRYVAPLPRASGHAGLYLQTLRLRPDHAGGVRLELSYLPLRQPGGTPTQAETHELLHVRSGHFSYLVPAPDGARQWRDSWTSARQLPDAIQLRLTPAAGRRVTFPTMMIPVHRRAGDHS